MNDKHNAVNWSKLQKLLLAVIFIMVTVVFALNFDIHRIEQFIYQYEKLGLVISTFVYLILGVTPIPSEPMTILLVAWKGPLTAIIIASIGNTLAALVEFLLGGGIGDLTEFESKKAKLPFHLGDLPIDSPVFLLLGRMLPGFGPKFVSLISGIYQVPLVTYLWTTVVSNILGAVMVAFGGFGLLSLFR